MRIAQCLLAVFVASAPSLATVTNFAFSKTTLKQNDSLSYTFASMSDTTYNEVWLETSGDTTLSSTDKVLYKFTMIDNDTSSKSDNMQPDRDTTRHKFQFGPQQVSFPAGRYYIKVRDADGSFSTAFAVTAIAAQRTISGTVTPPPGQSKQNIWISANPVSNQSDQASFDGLTDANGMYLISIDSSYQTVDSFAVGVSSKVNSFSGYRAVPTQRTVSVKNGNISGVDFSFTGLTSAVTGIVKEKNGTPAAGIEVQLMDAFYTTIDRTTTTDSGTYSLGSNAGTFRVEPYDDNRLGGYLLPLDTQFTLDSGETRTINFAVAKCDTLLYCQIRKDGAPFAGRFGVSVRGMASSLQSWKETTASAFVLYVAKSDSYYVTINFGPGYDSIPAGYALPFPQGAGGKHPGDTVYFDFIKSSSRATAPRSRQPGSLDLGDVRSAKAGLVVTFSVPETTPLALRLYDLRGKLVATLTQGTFGAGIHSVRWNGRKGAGGGYILSLTTGSRQISRRIAITN